MENMKLAFIGDSNWDIYVLPNKSLRAVPKPDKNSAEESFFGDKQHIRLLMANGYFHDKPTEVGLELLEGLHSKLCRDSRGNNYSLLQFKRDTSVTSY